MIIVHHLENSRSQRILWLLEELGVAYQVQRYARDRKTMLAPPELKAVHPLGKSPVISDAGVVIAETGAIIEHLVERHGNGRLMPPPGSEEHRRYRYWLHYAEGSLMPLLVMKLIFSKTTVAPTPWLIRPIAKAIANGVGQWYLDPNLKLHLGVIAGTRRHRLVRRCRTERCRRDHELPAGSRCCPRRRGERLSEHRRFPGPHPGAARVDGRAGQRWSVPADALTR